jgi:hypothetical protein
MMQGAGPLTQIVPIAITFVVIFFTLAVGSLVLQDLGEELCDYTWITNTTPATGCNSTINPATGRYFGCCINVNTGNNCTAWDTTKTALNVSADGLESIEELSSWGPTLALVVIASVIIAVLIAYLAKPGS